jgi:hypothetical protein
MKARKIKVFERVVRVPDNELKVESHEWLQDTLHGELDCAIIGCAGCYCIITISKRCYKDKEHP